MNVSTLPQARSAVKLSDDTQAGFKGNTLLVQYRSSLIAAMTLTDALKMAHMILAHARQCGVSIPDAASDLSQVPAIDFDSSYQPLF